MLLKKHWFKYNILKFALSPCGFTFTLSNNSGGEVVYASKYLSDKYLFFRKIVAKRVVMWYNALIKLQYVDL